MDEVVKLLTRRRTLRRWHHELTAPDAELTLIEVVGLWCVQQLQPRTFKEWGAALAPRLASEQQPPHEADTAPLTMLEAALLAGISANDRAIDMARALELIYEHVNIGALHQAATDPSYPKNQQQVGALAAWVRGEEGPPPFLVEAAKMLADGRNGG